MPTALDAELEAERNHMAASRAALHAMRLHAEAMYAIGEKIAGDPFAAETLGIALARRVAELADDPRTPLFLGRLDLDGAPVPGDEPLSGLFHIGCRHVADRLGEPLVLDWRAPISRAFYQASARDPQGVRTRRRFGFANGDLTSFEDERLDHGEELGTGSAILTAESGRVSARPVTTRSAVRTYLLSAVYGSS